MTITAGQQDDGTMDVTVSHGTSSSGDPNLTLLDYHRLQTPPMRGMTPEEAAAYKRLKSHVFTPISRGATEGVMEPRAIKEFDVLAAQLKAVIEARDAIIATLTAERNGWKAACVAARHVNVELISERDAIQAATRKVVEALRIARQYVQPFTYDSEKCDDALADPTIVALGRE